MVSCEDVKAQHYPTYEYTYDNAGNRIRRSVLVLKENTEKSVNDSVMVIEELLSQEFKILSYPNPTKGNIRFEIEDNKIEMGEYMLLDMSGRLMERGICNKYSMILDMSGYVSGMYLFQFYIGDKKHSYKIIKE